VSEWVSVFVWGTRYAELVGERVHVSGTRSGKVICRSLLGGMLNFYLREAA
jgi:hypothetical protein